MAPIFRNSNHLIAIISKDLATPEAFQENPSLVWEFYNYRRVLVSAKSPNPGYYAIRDLEETFSASNRSFTLATQNIDGFRLLAGNKNVIELHGMCVASIISVCRLRTG